MTTAIRRLCLALVAACLTIVGFAGAAQAVMPPMVGPDGTAVVFLDASDTAAFLGAGFIHEWEACDSWTATINDVRQRQGQSPSLTGAQCQFVMRSCAKAMRYNVLVTLTFHGYVCGRYSTNIAEVLHP